jgi:hypothetical protein
MFHLDWLECGYGRTDAKFECKRGMDFNKALLIIILKYVQTKNH